MKHAIAILAFTLVAGCAHETDWHEIRNQAIEMRVDVNAAAEDVETHDELIDATCALLGQGSRACWLLESLREIVRGSVSAAHRAIELYDATGIGLAEAQKAVRRVRNAVDGFALAVGRVERVVTNAVAENSGQGAQGPRDAGGPSPTEGGAGTAPAAGSQEPTAAPPGIGIP